MPDATRTSIHHFIQHTVNSDAARQRHAHATPHVLLIFDASGCVTRSDLAVLRSMVSGILVDIKAEVSLICVNHRADLATPYDPATATTAGSADAHRASDVDMFCVLADHLCDPADRYDGIVVMTEGMFAPFTAQALHYAVTGDRSCSDQLVLPPIGFFQFSSGAIPCDPVHVVTRHVSL
ncbi:hypothetical protein [Herbaspirillum sp. YR522]|uniref:hypothetical protein n=1 Tax=Herbaspirillum sp. YR522 TaxID=1144342 RepID=UPI00026FBC09|nr:hypothetical protein [Herbaspirillum sp. YR522]EJN07739.1 hypothetical protein PMI40_01738 [Herbaspirillum sp. YR522]